MPRVIDNIVQHLLPILRDTFAVYAPLVAEPVKVFALNACCDVGRGLVK
jgi:hypothetical protein